MEFMQGRAREHGIIFKVFLFFFSLRTKNNPQKTKAVTSQVEFYP